ncbi:unnamed protein product, partial [Brenthis ino]
MYRERDDTDGLVEARRGTYCYMVSAFQAFPCITTHSHNVGHLRILTVMDALAPEHPVRTDLTINIIQDAT